MIDKKIAYMRSIKNIIIPLFLLMIIHTAGLMAQMNKVSPYKSFKPYSDKTEVKSWTYDDEEYIYDTNYMYKGWSIGANFGFYFANKNMANFYNGSGTNDIGYVLDNIYWKESIEEEIGYNFDTIYPPWDLPQNMKYDAALAIGFYFKYNFSKSFALFFQTNYVKLKTTDIFILHLLKPSNTLVPRYNQYAIMGQEERFNIDAGVSKEVELNKVVRVYFETGLNMNNIKVLKNMIQIESRDYSIINVYGSQGYIPNGNMQEFQMRQGGIGWGILFGTGFRLVFNEHVSLDPGFTVYLQKNVIQDNTTYKPTYSHFGPSYMAFIRFTFKDFF